MYEKGPRIPWGTRGPGRKRFAPRCFPVLLNTVSSPRGALTAVFGMGTGVTPPPEARTKGVARDRYSPPGMLHEIVLSPHSQVRHGRSSLPAPGLRSSRIPGADGAQASRPIRSGMVNASRRLRIRPVERVVFPWPSGASRPGTARLRGGLALRCVQRLSLRGVATRQCPWQDSRNTRGRPPPVLSY